MLDKVPQDNPSHSLGHEGGDGVPDLLKLIAPATREDESVRE
jgi:hypothetical protein